MSRSFSRSVEKNPLPKSRFTVGQTVTCIDRKEDRPIDEHGEPLFVNIAIDGTEFTPSTALPHMAYAGALWNCLHYAEEKPRNQTIDRSPALRKITFIEIAGKRVFFCNFWDDLTGWPDNTGIVTGIEALSVTAMIVLRRGRSLWLVRGNKPVFGAELVQTWRKIRQAGERSQCTVERSWETLIGYRQELENGRGKTLKLFFALDPTPYERYPILAEGLPSQATARPVELNEQGLLMAQADWRMFKERFKTACEIGAQSPAAEEAELLRRRIRRMMRLVTANDEHEALLICAAPGIYYLNAAEYRLRKED